MARRSLKLQTKTLLIVVVLQAVFVLSLLLVSWQEVYLQLLVPALIKPTTWQTLQYSWLQSAAVVVVLHFLLMVVLSCYFTRYLSQRLETLRRGTASVSVAVTEGRFNQSTRIPVESGDELGELAKAFNKLIDNLELEFSQKDQFEDMLQDFNQQLEKKVKERTVQLELKNSVLNQTNQELKTAQKQLLHAEKMASVGQLAAGVAHEINNPVGYVLSNVKTLEQYLGDVKSAFSGVEDIVSSNESVRAEVEMLLHKYDVKFICSDLDALLKESEQGLMRVQEIVTSLKSFSHADSDEMRTADVNACLSNTLAMVNNQLKYHCKIDTDFCDDAVLSCNAGRLSQVFANILVNAGQAIQQNGQIKIRTVKKDTMLQIYIADNGKGIPQEHLKKLFDPFFTTKSEGEGTGLGLSISYGIVKDHDGNISVKSRQGKGTCFIISLPFGAEGLLTHQTSF